MMDILFDQERQDRLDRAALLSEGIGIGEARGEARGEAKGSIKMLSILVKDGIVSKEYASDKLGISVEEFDRRVAAAG